MMTRFVLIVVVALALGACSSAVHKVESEEVAAEFAGTKFTSLLVVGVYDDRAFRVSGEAAMVEELKARGVTAAPSYDLIPDPGSATAEQLAAAAAAGSHDGLLTVATLDPGYDYDAGDYMATRGAVYMLGGRPGAATDVGAMIAWAGSGLYTLYVGLWDGATGKPVWQVTTDSATTGSESADLKALADFVVDEMRKQGLL